MSDPSEDPSTFDVIADDLSSANLCWPDRISNLLISDFFRDRFDHQGLGWNEYKASPVLFDEPYDPDEPSRWASKSVAREADRGRPGTFRTMSRDIAVFYLLTLDESLASSVIDEAGKPKFRLLAEKELRQFSAQVQTFLGNIAITYDEKCRFCNWHGLERPKSDEQALTPDSPDGAVKEKPQPVVSKATAVRPNRRGRKKGIGGYDSEDMPLVEEMHRLIKIKEVTSPWNAALKVVDKAPGKRGLDSKLKRLVKKHAAKYGPGEGHSH